VGDDELTEEDDDEDEEADDGDQTAAIEDDKSCQLLNLLFSKFPHLVLSPDFGMHSLAGTIMTLLCCLMGTLKDKNNLGRDYDISVNNRVFNVAAVAADLAKATPRETFVEFCERMGVRSPVEFVSRASDLDITAGRRVLEESFEQLRFPRSIYQYTGF